MIIDLESKETQELLKNKCVVTLQNLKASRKYIVLFNNDYNIGDIVEVFHNDGSDCPYFSRVKDGEVFSIHLHRLYPVLTYDDIEVGMKVVLTRDYGFSLKRGEVVTIFDIDREDTDLPIRIGNTEMCYWVPFDLVVPLSIFYRFKSQKFKAGDIARVVGNTNPKHYYNIGSLVDITEVKSDRSYGDYICGGVSFDGGHMVAQSVSEDDLENVKKGEKPSVPKFVKVTGETSIEHGLVIGTIAKVEGADEDGDYDLIGISVKGKMLHQTLSPKDVEPFEEPVYKVVDTTSHFFPEGSYVEKVREGLYSRCYRGYCPDRKSIDSQMVEEEQLERVW